MARRGPGAILLTLAAAAFAGLNAINALKKGGDFNDYVAAGTRLIAGAPLYEGSGIGGGVIGPPFQAVLLAPFAAVAAFSLPSARLLWYLFNLASLAIGLRWWHLALASARPPDAPVIPAFVWPLIAVAFPLQSNFEHQNINTILLAVTGLVALRSTESRQDAAGAWLGAAIAIKAFPAVLAAVLAARRWYRAVAWSSGIAVLLTLLPVFRYGIDGYVRLAGEWMSLSGSGEWPIRRHNQSLFAMIARYLAPADLLTWGPLPDTGSPVAHMVWVAAAAALTAGTLWILGRPRLTHPGSVAVALAAGLALSVLLSPIAWEHYWLLLWPAFAVCYQPPAGTVGWVKPAFWAAAVLTSGISHPTVGRTAVALARGLSVRTWAALLVLAGTLAAFRALQHANPQRISLSSR